MNVSWQSRHYPIPSEAPPFQHPGERRNSNHFSNLPDETTLPRNHASTPKPTIPPRADRRSGAKPDSEGTPITLLRPEPTGAAERSPTARGHPLHYSAPSRQAQRSEARQRGDTNYNRHARGRSINRPSTCSTAKRGVATLSSSAAASLVSWPGIPMRWFVEALFR